MASSFLQSYKIVITRFFFPVLYFKLLRKIYGTYDQIFDMCASISNKNNNYKPGKSFSTQNHLLILWKKHREKGNIGKTQGILSRLECGHPESFLGRDAFIMTKPEFSLIICQTSFLLKSI